MAWPTRTLATLLGIEHAPMAAKALLARDGRTPLAGAQHGRAAD